MKNLIDYFTEESIIKLLCKYRVKVAKSRSDQHILTQLSKSNKYNYHLNESNQPDFIIALNTNLSRILPSRRTWVKLNKKSRYKRDQMTLISSFDKNLFSLIKTIKRDKNNNPNLPYLKELDKFIISIQDDIKNQNVKLEHPIIIPKPKNKITNGINPCRPISIFNIKDRIILSLVNRFLTDLLDPCFLKCSYAFRSTKYIGNKASLSHHDCVDAILNYRKKSKANKLWVVECDIKKFFDTVDHKTLLRSYKKLLSKVEYPAANIDTKTATKIFQQYLNIYSFSTDVATLKPEDSYWLQFKFDGEFEWVQEELSENYGAIKNARIGVPQGGALSGLISNILLHEVDREMEKQKVFYVRYCDDMVIITPYFNRSLNAKNVYLDSLKRAHLLAHNFNRKFVWNKSSEKVSHVSSLNEFYKSKSKGPYKWSNTRDSINWISFVGYEISFDREIRVRKKSLIKEMKKQNDILKKFKQVISKQRRATNFSAIQTFSLKLIGMSVGRVNMMNYDKIKNEMCWKTGFRLLESSYHARIQMKKLDRNRNKVINEFKKFLFRQPNFDSSKNSKNRQIVKLNKPFSYYYQIIERNGEQNP